MHLTGNAEPRSLGGSILVQYPVPCHGDKAGYLIKQPRHKDPIAEWAMTATSGGSVLEARVMAIVTDTHHMIILVHSPKPASTADNRPGPRGGKLGYGVQLNSQCQGPSQHALLINHYNGQLTTHRVCRHQGKARRHSQEACRLWPHASRNLCHCHGRPQGRAALLQGRGRPGVGPARQGPD